VEEGMIESHKLVLRVMREDPQVQRGIAFRHAAGAGCCMVQQAMMCMGMA
jgi:hypothetical protein